MRPGRSPCPPASCSTRGSHDDSDGFARVRIEKRGQLIVLLGSAGIRRISHEEVRRHVGSGGVDPGKRSGNLLRVGIARSGSHVRVAVHGEAYMPAFQRRPILAGGRAERCVGALVGKHEHAACKGRSGYGCQLEERSTRHADRARFEKRRCMVHGRPFCSSVRLLPAWLERGAGARRLHCKALTRGSIGMP